jgi:lipid II:glycine glycyltransferase (peptidoglycan interpeptide bridge formation enzyme)
MRSNTERSGTNYVRMAWNWQQEHDALAWDKELAKLGGHPLQSALWGNARQKVDGIPQLLLACHADNDGVVGLARIEARRAPLAGKIAWMPKGPCLPNADADAMTAALHAELKQRGFIACITNRYVAADHDTAGQPKTIWLDLTQGLDALSKALDSQWRYGARRALREGVTVRTTTVPTDVSAFFHLCNALSVTKGFSLPGSEALMQELAGSSLSGGAVGMVLYVGEVDGVIAGGALVARCGQHLHYLWGASDRRFSKYRVSEAVQWQVIQDGVAAGMTRYDLEGIDPAGNPGVYEFKRKMGGREVTLQGMETTPLSWVGSLAVRVGRRLGRLT